MLKIKKLSFPHITAPSVTPVLAGRANAGYSEALLCRAPYIPHTDIAG